MECKPDENRDFTLKQLAVHAGCSTDTVHRWLREGVTNRITGVKVRLVSRKIGGLRIVSLADFERFNQQLAKGASHDAIKCHNCGAIFDIATRDAIPQRAEAAEG